MLKGLKPTVVFDDYWRFAYERQQTYLRRLASPPESIGPWTDDPIIAAHRFTNAYRASDRVSQYLIRRVQYGEHRYDLPRDIFFRTMLFKIFNKIETWELLEAEHGEICWSGVNLGHVAKTLDNAMARGPIYSAAYIMPSPPRGEVGKHRNHLAMLTKMIYDKLPERISEAPSLKAVYELLLSYEGLGPFLAFQYAIDLNYSTLISFDESEFVVAGPGALDGIAKAFGAPQHPLIAARICHEMAVDQEEEFARFGLDFPGLFGRPLQPIDCQNLFCEISKYSRLKRPEIKGANDRTKIKQIYRASAQGMPTPFFPPKWNINDRAVCYVLDR